MPLATRASVFMWLGMVALTIVVVAPAQAVTPSASFAYSPGAPFTNEVVTFVSTSSGPVSSESWDLNGDRICNDATGPSAQRAFATSGVYSVTLCVSGGTGSSTATDMVTIRNRPPTAAFTYSPGSPVSGDSVVLTSISADPDGPIMAQAWDLDGDGAYDDGQGATASVRFPAAGDYRVGLLVTDRDGTGSAALRAIHVQAPAAQFINPFPVVRMVGKIGRRGTRIKEIVVKVPRGGKVRISCRGGGCPGAAKRTGGAGIARNLHIRRFAHRTLRPGAVVRVWVTKPGAIGKYTRFRIRAGKPPSRIDRCLMPGKRRPVRCGS